MINNQIKYKDKKQVINSLIAKIPFKTCHSTDVVLYSEIFSPNDPMLSILDSYLSELEEKENDMYKEVVAKALSYTISRIKMSCWTDQNGCLINDKFHYFKNSLNSNIERVKKNIIGYKLFNSLIDNLATTEVVNEDELSKEYINTEDIESLDDELPF